MSQSPSLFAIFVGGRHPRGTIELHDVQFVVAHELEQAFPTLRARWWGEPASLHVDAYAKLTCVDGYKVTLVPAEQAARTDLSLYFVNVGGYQEGVFGEAHAYSFHVGRDKRQIWAAAKARADFGQQHQDDFKSIDDIVCVDDRLAAQRYALVLTPAEPGAPEAHVVAAYIKLDGG